MRIVVVLGIFRRLRVNLGNVFLRVSGEKDLITVSRDIAYPFFFFVKKHVIRLCGFN